MGNPQTTKDELWAQYKIECAKAEELYSKAKAQERKARKVWLKWKKQ